MHILTSRGVVEEMTAELANRRRDRLRSHTAYLALARAILSDDEPEQRVSLSVEGGVAATPDSARAAA